MKLLVKDLCKSYDGRLLALKPSSFAIHSGEFISLLGPSGCGKTTLLRLLAGLETPDGGFIQFGDQVVYSSEAAHELPAEKRNIGMVFQDFALWPHMTVFENIAFGLRARRQTTHLNDQVYWALEKVRLSGFETRYPRQLSGGQQQRVSFARAIVTKPQLILLDEPLSALDAMLRDELRVELVSIVKELGLTAIYVTHDQSESMSMSDRIFVMNAGAILQSGAPEDLYNRPQHSFVAHFIGKSNELEDDQHQLKGMVRPEKLRTQPHHPDDLTFSGIVSHVAFLGDRYEVFVRFKDRLWTSYLPFRPAVGDDITLYLAPGDVQSIP
ncbi:ABC transporter ATP-binding protein [Anoxynatronum buryatiense]|uniref:ABC-type quaternary amine transporter n=1 Tax=Anoxynatronum buryatiense TaxID=489973 RepID=A0AA45WVW2_9CLOT|nr:ABC transporter ATP-binding protein [Anoxynatronum buryatiense]SMP55401.1 iron(III) transport system ATP-binding protein [Anoxynatronum buryatiense]